MEEKPPYWGKCEKMSFVELRKFIDDCLKGRLDPVFDADCPHSKEEFLELANMLDAKLDELRKDASNPPPPPPVYHGPPYISSHFEPSEQLDPLYEKRERLEALLLDAQWDPPGGQSYIDHIERELRDVEREIDLRETGEREEHEKRLADYQATREEYDRRYRLWSRQQQEHEERLQSLVQRERIVSRIRRDIESAFELQPTGHVPFEILPPGEATEDRVRGYYEGLRRRGKLPEFDQERLDKVLVLPWEDWRPGKAGRYGYSIFTFSHTDKVLLECPVYANAIYILNSGEERLLKMNKQELIASGEAKRIFHTKNWYRRVKQELGIQ